ncbi:MAG: S-layer homology domain-containing protein [Acidimicrobiales bacterium]
MISRRRVLQTAAAVPALGLLPGFVRTAGANAGTPVGAGAIVEADGLTGLSLSWTGDTHTGAVVRALVDGTWGQDIEVESDHGHGPDDPSGRAHGPAVMVPGAEAYWVANRGVDDLRVHEITAPERRLRAAALTIVTPIPGLEIIDRSSWTDIPRRDTIDCALTTSVFGLGCRADVGLRHGIVHHTVNPNGYSESAVPDLIHGIQRYHVDTRGWDDIGYNFVIDRFGRIWQGREGDLYEPIAAGHTTGLNGESVGVAVLGTFSTDTVPDAVVESLGLLLGWKLSLHGVDPLGHTLVRSAGSDLAEPGEFVDVDNISGHRDNGQTSCPGTVLYERLDEIRSAAAELVPVFGHLTPTYSLDDVRCEGWVIDRFSPAEAQDIEIIVDGGEPIVITADGEVDDLADDYPDAGAAHGFDHTVPIDLDTTSIVVRATAADGRTADLMDLTLFATFVDVEPTRFFAPGVYYLRQKGLTTGTRPGLFEPMDHVTRGQMATFLHRFMDLPPFTAPAPFVDLVEGAFYEAAVNWLYESGVTTGTSPTTFEPEAFVTRGQMATFLWRMCGQPAAQSSAVFSDVPSGAFYEKAVAWMAELGITTGISPTLFAPLDRIRRGEMATFLQRLGTTPEAWTLVEPPSAVDF